MSNIQGTKPEKPSDWCQRMMDNAKDGNEAYNYYELKQMWLGRNQ